MKSGTSTTLSYRERATGSALYAVRSADIGVDDRTLAHTARSTGPGTGLELAGRDHAHSQVDLLAV
jgi:hypothetical protein